MEIQGFSESVAMVRDMEATAGEFCRLSGWHEVLRSDCSPALLQAWGLPPEAQGRECLLLASGEQRGGLRLMELSGAGPQTEIRPNPQTWDTGGYLDLNARVEDMPRRRAEFCASGWHGTSDPVTWQFGDKQVCEWLTLSPEGIALALIERLDPPLPPGSVPGGFGPLFNSTQVVRDMEESLAFYEHVLGFNKLLHICQPLMPEPAENVLGIPHNLVCELDSEITILSPGGEMDGSIELIRMHGLEGRDFRQNARPPNLGLLALRFPIGNISELRDALNQAGIAPAFEPVAVEILPIGPCQLMAVQAPEGAWLEFYQPL